MGYLRAKSRLRRLRYETRLRAQSFVTIFLSDGGRFPIFFDSLMLLSDMFHLYFSTYPAVLKYIAKKTSRLA